MIGEYILSPLLLNATLSYSYVDMEKNVYI